MYRCEICGKNFKHFQNKANHYRWNHLYTYKSDDSRIKAMEKARSNNERLFGKYVYETSICSNIKCQKQINIRYREGKRKNKYFCSRSCSNSRNFSSEMRSKQSKTIKKLWKDGIYDNIFDKENENNIKFFSSKKEREIVEYFKNRYIHNEWKSGGLLIYKGQRISRDLYSDKLKICFEYDGIWHFKNINNQIDQKKLKDKMLEEWCKEKNYRLVRIDEDKFKDFEQIEKLFYIETDKIIKIGDRYDI